MERDAGHLHAALRWAEQLYSLAPDDPESRALVTALRAGAP